MYSSPVIRVYEWLIADYRCSSMGGKVNGLMLTHAKESEIKYKRDGFEMQGHRRGILCILKDLAVQTEYGTTSSRLRSEAIVVVLGQMASPAGSQICAWRIAILP